MKYELIMLLSILFYCCQSGRSGKLQNESSDVNSGLHLTQNKGVDSVRFLNNCKSLMERSWQGALQVENHHQDSTNFLCFAACYDCVNTFEIVFLFGSNVETRRQMGYSSIWSIFQDGCGTSFKDFQAYAFVAPMIDPESLEDIHKPNMSFPCDVKAYRRVINDNWRLVDAKTVKDLNSYNEYRFEIIYDLNK